MRINHKKSIILFFTTLSLVLLLITPILIKSPYPLHISEVCPHNSTVIYDKVGIYSDFITIKNYSKESINLKGYTLSDDKYHLNKYTFPDKTLLPNDSLIVWASTPSPKNEIYIDPEDLFLYFSLSDNETLFFCDNHGRIIDKIFLGETAPDEALIRQGVNSRYIVSTPSELESPSIVVSGSVNPPFFSNDSGFYASPFYLSLDAGNNEIYYTIDGTNPTESGLRYSNRILISDNSASPNRYASIAGINTYGEAYESESTAYIPQIPVDKGTVIRAVARNNKGEFSKEMNATFFIGSNLKEKYTGISTISLITDPNNLFSDDKGIYVTGNIWEENKSRALDSEREDRPTNYNMSGPGWHRSSFFTLFDKQGKASKSIYSHVAIHGACSRSSNQKGFSIIPDKQNELIEINPLSDEGDGFVLRSCDRDETNLCDAICKNATFSLDLGSADTQPCNLFIDGEYWGCYVLQMKLDASYIANKFGVDEDNVILIKNNQLESGDKNDFHLYEDVLDFLWDHDMSDTENYSLFCSMVDIDSLIDLYCTELYTQNTDSIDNNMAMWRVKQKGSTPYEDGKWRYILFDSDCTLKYQSLDPFDIIRSDQRTNAIKPLSQNTDFMIKFTNRLLQMSQTEFYYFESTDSTLYTNVHTLSAECAVPVTLSNQRFISPSYSEDDYWDKVDEITYFLKERQEYVIDYLTAYLIEIQQTTNNATK